MFPASIQCKLIGGEASMILPSAQGAFFSPTKQHTFKQQCVASTPKFTPKGIHANVGHTSSTLENQ